MEIQVINKSNNQLPSYKTDGSSGMDLQANIEAAIELKPLERVLVPTGLFISIPKGYEGQIRGRSGLALKYGIGLANGIGTIDSDYRGEIKVILVNMSNENYIINKGDRIAQFILSKYEKIEFKEVENLKKTTRGDGGFGHTGI
ncbi:dUTP diphosphatase [Tissierella creatinophila]|uniref:Deoxyuridine 5'-triphosphate nucleotidohydrolase n=1 Tax=Tissierella creatinophila DSM 6911 TaxID=1123403 RepID=A0A1U7M397_TISCR|nr:dUTP diphosphatase [Tissierella creatinophila]OLS01771.1 deoxyuridine 5'-triphosphate nucleotidohydrolase [Tissierella creatinophila DSM 6911]